MKQLKIQPATYARLGALIVAVINQCLAIFGKGALPFTENMAYQVISLALTIIVAAVNAWYNNDCTQVALITGKIFDGLKDGDLTEEEIETIVAGANNKELIEEYNKDSFIVGFANGVLASIKNKTTKTE